MDIFLRDMAAGTAKPIYNHMNDLPEMAAANCSAVISTASLSPTAPTESEEPPSLSLIADPFRGLPRLLGAGEVDLGGGVGDGGHHRGAERTVVIEQRCRADGDAV